MLKLGPMPAENAGRAFALVLADALATHGVRHAVIAPGSRSTPIALALIEHPQIAVHVRVDERSAAFLALGIAKASGEIVPVLCTSGTATSYFHGAVMEADLSCIPLLVITADRPPELHGIGANQTVDQRSLYGSAVRWAADPGVPESRPDAVAAWQWLVSQIADLCLGRRLSPAGPVHLNVPLREPLTPTPDGDGFPYDLKIDAGLARPHHGRDAARPPGDLLDRLCGASRGVVIAGGRSKGSTASIHQFTERAGWPLIAEPHSQARYGPMALRSTDGLLRDTDFIIANRPDLVVVVGRVGLSRALLDWLTIVPHIVISPDGRWDVTRSAAAVIDCSADVLAQIDIERADPEWAKTWSEASGFVSRAIDAVLDADDMLTEPRVARDVAAGVADGTALVVSSSMPIRDLDLVMRPREHLQILANRGVSGIDGFVSTAQGIALANDASPTVALCGDLSLLHDINGLIPGPDSRPDLTYVVINNDGGGIFSLLPQASSVDPAAFERLFGTPHGMSLEQVAAAYHADHTLVSNAEELRTALAASEGVRIIEVRTDRAENAALHARLREITPRTA
jgi:2-succinyl-5-enolpyruvyl-6-hydroxy-3-cyclohexene-1-carboxylate synthase